MSDKTGIEWTADARIEVLRSAGSLMIARADAATPGPWWQHRDQAEVVWYGDEALTYAMDRTPDDYTDTDWESWSQSTGQLSHGDLRRAEDAAHIASWHPEIARLVAAVLLHEADIDEQYGAPASALAVDIARTYLGEQATPQTPLPGHAVSAASTPTSLTGRDPARPHTPAAQGNPA